MSPNSNAKPWNSWALSQWVYPFHAPAAPTNALPPARNLGFWQLQQAALDPLESAAGKNRQRANQRIPSPCDGLQHVRYEACYL